MAEGGTLFLDEIGDMPADAQTRLLRVLQDGEYLSIAGNGTVRANVRIIAATNRNLHHLMQQGLFSQGFILPAQCGAVKIAALT
ncbi:MAG: hypothetical protein CM15mP46_2750 [Alphaproteobacteria bacterium]|nr:MAG: hypothetical protein CM15mP46_2750 [Alphaproteobacteria bacterium]